MAKKSQKLKSKWYRPRTKRCPIPMVGDPPYKRDSWDDRCKVLYAHAMKAKRGALIREDLAT